MNNLKKWKPGYRAWCSITGDYVELHSQRINSYPIAIEVGIFTYGLTEYGELLEGSGQTVLFSKPQIFDYSEPVTEPGTLCFFWNEYFEYAVLSKYKNYNPSTGNHFSHNGTGYKHFCIYPELPPHLKAEAP